MEAGDAANQAHFHAWLCTALAQVRLEDDVYVGYVESILQEDSYSSLDEKKEAVLEFLASSTEENLDSFGEQLVAEYGKIEDVKNARLEASKQEELSRLQAVQLQQQLQREEKAKQRTTEQQLSKEERKQRRELLERYGYQVETTDENGDIVLTENLCDIQDGGSAVEQNDNTRKIVQEAQAEREKAREKHQQKVVREKELLARDHKKKEDRKKRTEKREKRRL